MSQIIHPTAIIESGASLGSNVKIGPYCVVGAQVTLGDDVELVSHVTIAGITTIGPGTKIFPFASIGHAPQDKKYHGEPSRLEIGAHNVIREYVTMQPGTEGGGMLTKVGDNGLFMVGTHVAHDCEVGSDVILANYATLAGHVSVGDRVVIGGLAAVHQFVRIGEGAMIGGLSGVENDVIPYGLVMGKRANLCGLNLVGLKRRGIEREEVHELRQAYRQLFAVDDGVLAERLQDLVSDEPDSDLVRQLIEFIQADSSRPLCLPEKLQG
jgi:UDP-N-acetylglucosamine acyltransferase